MLAAQQPVQSLRGTIANADNARPLAGASVLVLDTDPVFGTTSSLSGAYVLEKLPVGRYRVQFSFVGFETLTLAEVLVEPGRETVLDVQLQPSGETLQEVVVKGQGRGSASLQPLGAISMTVEEQFRFPATYYDPARLATAYPGVAGENDGTNIISVRGNSPSALQWRLEGVEIVNPNHTANAGTFGDRPTQAAGGVNILSAQMLGTSTFLTSAFPAEYGNSLGGILDMRLRNGNGQRHERIAQAGFIGVEAALEGPFSASKTVPGENGASYLANYRYSFTGLLTALGVDFGDEATSFQDLSFHVALPSAQAGQFSVFGLGGNSSTTFRSPLDSSEVLEQKQRYNIDFASKMGAAGLSHLLPLGKNSVWRSTVVASALEHERTADLVFGQPAAERWEDDRFSESKISLSTVVSHRFGLRATGKVGLLATSQSADLQSFYKHRSGAFELAGRFQGWLLQPFVEGVFVLAQNLDLRAGVHVTQFTHGAGATAVEPRVLLRFSPAPATQLSLAYGLNSQLQSPNLYPVVRLGAGDFGLTRSHQVTGGFRQMLSKSLVFNAEAYFQNLYDVPVLGEISTLNLTDFSLPYVAALLDPNTQFAVSEGEGRNYGLDLYLQQFITKDAYFLLSGSLYRSAFSTPGGQWQRTRFDGGHTLNLTGGREFTKTKATKTLVRGVNARIAWLGGFRDRPIDAPASEAAGYTVYQPGSGFSIRQPDYFRADMRLYLKWYRSGKNSTLSLDIQNITGRENVQYSYYDAVQEKVVEKRQLSLIPILTWRGEF